MVVNLNLKVAAVKNVVEVGDIAPSLHPTDSSVGEVIEPVAVRDLPLNGRMLIDLMLTVPGAHVSHGAQTGNMNPLYWRPGQRSAVSIGGNRPNANYFLLDGTTNTDPTFNTLNLSPSPDAVQEFKVETGSYSAEMGGAGGGQVNIVTRSGSNQYHGTVYEFLRNGAMDATSFQAMGNNHMVQNNFGGSFGGPIVRNKTFFFANYEGFRHAMTDTMIDTVPTPEEVAGDFSMSGVNIYDPTNNRAQFQYNGMMNVIPPIADQRCGSNFPAVICAEAKPDDGDGDAMRSRDDGKSRGRGRGHGLQQLHGCPQRTRGQQPGHGSHRPDSLCQSTHSPDDTRSGRRRDSCREKCRLEESERCCLGLGRTTTTSRSREVSRGLVF